MAANTATPTPPASTLTLAAAITPSRAGCPPVKAVNTKGSKGKKNKGDQEEEEITYLSPPPKNAAERAAWERMSTRMQGFHTYFEQTFQQIWQFADKFEEQGLSLKDYLEFAEGLEHHLGTHHGIEERYVFPVLAQKMPEFRDEHVEEHKKIHDGLDRYTAYIAKAKKDPRQFSAESFREQLQSWGPILFYHMASEVKSLRPDNLRRYYTLEEVKRLPM